jgi:hypothetical protein
MLVNFCCTKVGRCRGVPSGTYLPWHFLISVSLRYTRSFVFGEPCGKDCCKQTAKGKPIGPLAARDFVHRTYLTGFPNLAKYCQHPKVLLKACHKVGSYTDPMRLLGDRFRIEFVDALLHNIQLCLVAY